jgi:CBS domain containing-hemolysin-like protein
MLVFVLYLLLALITLFTIGLLKVYTDVPSKELKRRVRAGDELATLLYRAASYEASLRILLWLIIGLSASGFFVLMTRSVPGWEATLGCLALLWLGFAWLPSTHISNTTRKMASYVARPLAWVLQRLYPLLNHIAVLSRRWRVSFHTGLYEKDDLLNLLDHQLGQTDNRVTDEELRTAKSALTFGDKIVRDVMIPRSKVVAVSATDAIGPILMTELHDSGHTRFPVYEDKDSEKVVGTLYLRDLLNIKAGGHVRDHMATKVFYLHDETPLDRALQAFLGSKHHLFIVVNSFEDILGVVTIEDILEQVIGRPIDDEFTDYDDPHAVAAYKNRRKPVLPAPPPVTIEAEVVESE